MDLNIVLLSMLLYPLGIVGLLIIWRTLLKYEHLRKRCMVKKSHSEFTHTMSVVSLPPLLPPLINSRRRCQPLSRVCLAIDYEAELRTIQRIKAAWHEAHPYGPVNNKEVAELDWLILAEAGTIVTRSGDLGCPHSIDSIDRILSDIEDWRL